MLQNQCIEFMNFTTCKIIDVGSHQINALTQDLLNDYEYHYLACH